MAPEPSFTNQNHHATNQASNNGYSRVEDYTHGMAMGNEHAFPSEDLSAQNAYYDQYGQLQAHPQLLASRFEPGPYYLPEARQQLADVESFNGIADENDQEVNPGDYNPHS
jgi:hypothetical protein